MFFESIAHLWESSPGSIVHLHGRLVVLQIGQLDFDGAIDGAEDGSLTWNMGNIVGLESFF